MNPIDMDFYSEWIRLSNTIRHMARLIDADLDRRDRIRFAWHARTWSSARRKLRELIG